MKAGSWLIVVGYVALIGVWGWAGLLAGAAHIILLLATVKK